MPELTNNDIQNDIQILTKIEESNSGELSESAYELRCVLENSNIEDLEYADESMIDRLVQAIKSNYDYDTETFQCASDYEICIECGFKIHCVLLLLLCLPKNLF